MSTPQSPSTQSHSVQQLAETRHYFVVAGSGEFPGDMLRHDQCWPISEEDAGKVVRNEFHLLTRRADFETERHVTLGSDSAHAPHIARWESFGWRVISHGRLGERLAREAVQALKIQIDAKSQGKAA